MAAGRRQRRQHPLGRAGATTGTSTWNGEEPYWVDVTCYGIEIETYVGRDRAVDQWEVGTATIVLDNDTGWADYPPTVDPNPFDLTVRPGRQIRVAVVGRRRRAGRCCGVAGSTRPTPASTPSTATSSPSNASTPKARSAVSTSPPSIRRSAPANRSTPACDRICDGAGWSAYWRNFDDAGITVVGTTLGGQAADLLNRAADSGGGSLFGDVDAKLRYRNRDWQLWPADELEDADDRQRVPRLLRRGHVDGGSARLRPVLRPDRHRRRHRGPAGSGLYDAVTDLDMRRGSAGLGAVRVRHEFIADVCPTNWEMTFAREDITTRVLIGRPDMDTPIVLDDDDGQELYGVETVDLTDLETAFDVEMTSIGNRLLVTRGHTTMPRIAAVTLNAATDPGRRRPARHRRPPHPVAVPLPARLRRPPSVQPVHVLHRGPSHDRPRPVGSPPVPRRRHAVAGRRRRRVLVKHRDGRRRALAGIEMAERTSHHEEQLMATIPGVSRRRTDPHHVGRRRRRRTQHPMLKVTGATMTGNLQAAQMFVSAAQDTSTPGALTRRDDVAGLNHRQRRHEASPRPVTR